MELLIGNIAGKIWELLIEHETLGAIKIKSSIGIPNSLMYLALGWLARENKIEIIQKGHTFEISLKK